MGVWVGSIQFADRRGKRTIKMTFPNAAGLFDGAEFLTAKAAVAGVASAMAAISECSVGHSLTFIEEPVDVAGMSAAIDRHDTLQMVDYLDSLDAYGYNKTWSHPIPAPVEAIMVDGSQADVNDALLADLQTAFQAADSFGWRVSDGERIDYTLGVNGIKSGEWLSRAGK